ncbi:LAME_0H19042g1_1 [Lachancea meyersii CBS 8951]|uniref:LAME_0H19042g1_1 n=1 Tax=Lachancea meyersii CBS 8951 TaxID=1266667 RepID=A0A1G4KJG2_9SACH|nr:LAME_0H19042g1_1 [Lachancea meyersii CBS 8951]
MVKKKRNSVPCEPSKRPSIGNGVENHGSNGPELADLGAQWDVQEKLMLALFTTRPGLEILELYYELSCGHVNLHQYKKWQSAKHRAASDDEQYKSMVKKWTESYTYICLLMDFLLQNEQQALDYTSYCRAASKMSLRFLLDANTELLIVDDDYNLMLDFLLHCRSKIEQTLNQASLPSLLFKFARTTKRLYQLSGRFTWYTLKAQEFKKAPDIVCKYLAVLTDKLTAQHDLIPQLQPFFDAMNSNKIAHFSKTETNGLDVLDNDSSSETEEWSSKKGSSLQDRVYSFDLNEDGTLEAPNVFSRTRRRHQILYYVLRLHEQNSSPLLKTQFYTLCALVDPVTQPIPSDSHIVSIDLLSDLFLGLLSTEIETLSLNWRFHICFNLHKIVHASLSRLNCNDFQRLNSVNNSDESVDWRSNLHKWLPQGLNTQDLELVYMVDILAIYLLHKLYRDLPIQMNPFLGPMISLWKNLTFVVLLGLEIDRFEEEQETFSTPVIVRATIRGASALRSVVATILNGHVEYKRHDFKHEPINIFMSPHGRKLCNGALYTDVRSHAAAMLALGIELEDVTNLLSDLQPGDRFDEDVKYMFDYEYDNYNEVDTEELDEEELEDAESRERIKEMRAYYKRCHCQFDDDELLPDDAEYSESNASKAKTYHEAAPETRVKATATNKPVAHRSKRDGVDFDFKGRDWRDIPRGLNFYFNERYEFMQTLSTDVAASLMKAAGERKLTFEEGEKLLRLTASCVAREQEHTVLQSAAASQEDRVLNSHYTLVGDGDLTTDYIYEHWCEDSLFERTLQHNEILVWRQMDEMLMCSGYRRVLVWFITHLEVNRSMIEYIYTLIMGERGEIVASEDDHTKNQNEAVYDKVPFSRQGPLQLSEIEVKMLLQEIFTNFAIFFSKYARESGEYSDGEQIKEDGDHGIPPRILGFMKLVCLMVKRLMAENKFDLEDPDYIFELQTLLMSWICILPDARELFFELKSQAEERTRLKEEKASERSLSRPSNSTTEAIDLISPEDSIASDTELDTAMSVYNQKLLALLPPVADKQNSAVTALRTFISKHSLTMKTAVFGRRVISQDDEILGMYMSDREMDNRQFLAEFGIDFNDFVDGVYNNKFTTNESHSER